MWFKYLRPLALFSFLASNNLIRFNYVLSISSSFRGFQRTPSKAFSQVALQVCHVSDLDSSYLDECINYYILISDLYNINTASALTFDLHNVHVHCTWEWIQPVAIWARCHDALVLVCIITLPHSLSIFYSISNESIAAYLRHSLSLYSLGRNRLNKVTISSIIQSTHTYVTHTLTTGLGNYISYCKGFVCD